MGGSRSNKHQVLEMTEENGLAWTVKADLPANRRGAASTVHEGKIVVMGGHVGGEISASVLTYDPDADAWATAPPLPGVPSAYGTATAIDGSVVLYAGRVYQYRNGGWQDIAGAPAVRVPSAEFALLG